MTTPELSEEVRSGRRYVWDGVQYPSVTTILNELAKHALPHWYAKQVAQFAVEQKDQWIGLEDDAAVDLLKRQPLRFRDGAAGRGTRLHAAVPNMVGDDHSTRSQKLAEAAGGMVEADFAGLLPAVRDYCDQHVSAVIAQEVTVFSDEFGYAGTCDMIIRDNDGDGVVVDWKTGRAWPEAALQLAAYAAADWMAVHDPGAGCYRQIPMPDIARLHVVQLPGDGSYQCWDVDNRPELAAVVEAVATVHRWRSKPGRWWNRRYAGAVA